MDTSQPFLGKVAVVTGAASGIGRATAIKLASMGATLALADLNESALQATSALCTEAAGKQGWPQPLCASVDVGKADQVHAFVAAAVAQCGRSGGHIHFVFNCAGVNPTKLDLADITDAHYDTLMDASMRGTFLVTRACLPHLQPGAASVVNVSSIVGLRPKAGMAVYAAAKAGIVALTKSVALELGPKGIRCNVVAPGEIDTPTNRNVVVGGAALAAAKDRVALGRMGTAAEVADVVAFLFSDESRYMNGSVVEINGGIY